MNASSADNSQADQCSETCAEVFTVTPTPIDPTLGASIEEDAEDMKKGMRKADQVVAHLEQELGGKAREIAYLKRLLGESGSKFAHLEQSIAAMRRERHKLANEVMRTVSLELSLKKVTMERDRAIRERDGILQGLAEQVSNNPMLRFDPRDVQIAELTVQLMNLKREVAEAVGASKENKSISRLKTSAAESYEGRCD